MRKKYLRYWWLAHALLVIAAVAWAVIPGPAEAGENGASVAASTMSSHSVLGVHSDLLDCAGNPGRHQIHCHEITPLLQAAVANRTPGDDDPGIAVHDTDTLLPTLDARVAIVVTVASSWRVPRHFFGNFRS